MLAIRNQEKTNRCRRKKYRLSSVRGGGALGALSECQHCALEVHPAKMLKRFYYMLFTEGRRHGCLRLLPLRGMNAGRQVEMDVYSIV